MKNSPVIVAVVAIAAFSLGYYWRGSDEGPADVPVDTEEPAVREYPELSEAMQPIQSQPVSSDASSPLVAESDRETVMTSTRSSPRLVYVENKRRRLEEFFEINGIDSERAEQIIQDLVDADHYIVQVQNAMYDRHTAEEADSIAHGDQVTINLTPEERAELRSEQEELYQEIFGEYYEAHNAYQRTYPQRQVVGALASRLDEPLSYSARETMVQILYEERSRLESQLANSTEQSGDQTASASSNWDAERTQYSARLSAMSSYNQRILDRSRSYLTASQYEQFEALLDNEVRRFELLLELADVEEGL